MNDSFIEFKKLLKLIKKDLEEFVSICELELIKYEELIDKVNAIKYNRENGNRRISFNSNDIDNELVLIKQSIKYNNVIKRLINLISDCGISLPIDDISFNGGKYIDGKLYFRKVSGEEIFNYLKNEEVLNNNDILKKILVKYSNGDLTQIIKLTRIYINFRLFIIAIKEYIKDINNLIISIDDDQIKAPINDISILYSNLILLRMSSKDINNILGSAIIFNSKYAAKNKNHKIKDIELTLELVKYYEGTNKDNILLEELLNKLKDNSLNYFRLIITFNNLIWLVNNIPKEIIKDFYTKLPSMQYINKCIINILSNIKEENIIINDNNKNLSIKINDIEFYKYLRLFYKNGEIISIPDNIEEFYIKLNNSSLDINEKKYIKRLMEERLESIRNNNRLSYLSDNDRNILELATKLLDTMNKNNPDIWILKQYLEDIQTIFDMLNEELSLNNKDELLRDLSNIISNISIICDKYKVIDNSNINRFLFLLNKDNIPYIYEDINSIDQSYRKSISSIISRINPLNKSNFKPLKNNKLNYQMYEYISSNIRVIFIEIDMGIYIIIGADKVRTNSEVFSNRLKLNEKVIKEIHSLIKNMDTRNSLLKSHEVYLNLITKNKTNSKKKIITKR